MAVISAECSTRKCGGCTGDGDWSDEANAVVPCEHHCHQQPEPEDFAEVFDDDGMPDL